MLSGSEYSIAEAAGTVNLWDAAQCEAGRDSTRPMWREAHMD